MSNKLISLHLGKFFSSKLNHKIIRKSFSTTINTKYSEIKNEVKCCAKKIPIVELGQPTSWTHPHLFDKLTDEVTPGLVKNEFHERRDNYVTNLLAYQKQYFSSKLKNSFSGDMNFIAVIPSGMTSYLAPDVPHIFKQNSDFLYLTGFKEPNSLLVISKTSSNSSYKTALFVKEKNPKTELWEGPCSGSANINKLTGIEHAFSINDVKKYLNSLVKETNNNQKIALWRYPTEFVQSEAGPNCMNIEIEEYLNEFKDDSKLIDMLNQDSINGTIAASYYNTSRYFVQLCRVKKSEAEINIMRKANEISGEAFKNSMNLSHPYIDEHLLHSKFDFDCKIRGADRLAYIPVIAGGSRATILHYIRNNQIIDRNSLLLMDAGCEYRDYASDITRTWPVNGKFTNEQKDLYEACLNVQNYCIDHCEPGITLQKLYNLMMSKLGEELNNLGLIDKKYREEVIKFKKNPFDGVRYDYLNMLTQFCPHDIGHYLGLDVHDSPEVTKMLKLDKGCVITVEPGIYIRSDNFNVPERYRGIGIRIEDNIVISDTGNENLSKNIPKSVSEIENLQNRS